MWHHTDVVVGCRSILWGVMVDLQTAKRLLKKGCEAVFVKSECQSKSPQQYPSQTFNGIKIPQHRPFQVRLAVWPLVRTIQQSVVTQWAVVADPEAFLLTGACPGLTFVTAVTQRQVALNPRVDHDLHLFCHWRRKERYR